MRMLNQIPKNALIIFFTSGLVNAGQLVFAQQKEQTYEGYVKVLEDQRGAKMIAAAEGMAEVPYEDWIYNSRYDSCRLHPYAEGAEQYFLTKVYIALYGEPRNNNYYLLWRLDLSAPIRWLPYYQNLLSQENIELVLKNKNIVPNESIFTPADPFGRLIDRFKLPGYKEKIVGNEDGTSPGMVTVATFWGGGAIRDRSVNIQLRNDAALQLKKKIDVFPPSDYWLFPYCNTKDNVADYFAKINNTGNNGQSNKKYDITDLLGDRDGVVSPEEKECFNNAVNNSPDGFIWAQCSGALGVSKEDIRRMANEYNKNGSIELFETLEVLSPDPTFDSVIKRGISRSSSGVLKIDPRRNKVVSIHDTYKGEEEGSF